MSATIRCRNDNLRDWNVLMRIITHHSLLPRPCCIILHICSVSWRSLSPRHLHPTGMTEEKSCTKCYRTVLLNRSTWLLSDSRNTAKVPATNGLTDMWQKAASGIVGTPSMRRCRGLHLKLLLQQLHHNSIVHSVSLLLYRLCKSPKLSKDFWPESKKVP